MLSELLHLCDYSTTLCFQGSCIHSVALLSSTLLHRILVIQWSCSSEDDTLSLFAQAEVQITAIMRRVLSTASIDTARIALDTIQEMICRGILRTPGRLGYCF